MRPKKIGLVPIESQALGGAGGENDRVALPAHVEHLPSTNPERSNDDVTRIPWGKCLVDVGLGEQQFSNFSSSVDLDFKH